MRYTIQKEYLILILLVLIVGAITGYFNYQNNLLKEELVSLENHFLAAETEYSSTTKHLNEIIDGLQEDLAERTAERDEFERKYNAEKSRLDLLALQISGIQGTVGLLEKLSETDPELLKKYSKVYFLNENYVPEELVRIDPQHTYRPEEEYLFHSKVWPFLEDLLLSADRAGVDIKVISAYRSFDTQTGLKDNYEMIYGSGANQFSADQGYSEHQLGTTIDFTTSEIGARYTGFEETAACQWLLENAYKYGFILSYPEDNQYYQFEPWHWRFVGRTLAEELHQTGRNFYELDQRAIDNYLIFFFD